MRLIHRESIGSLRFRRYRHSKHGVVETLTQKTVVFVRPCFGLLPKDEPQVAKLRAQKPKVERGRRLGGMATKRQEADAP